MPVRTHVRVVRVDASGTERSWPSMFVAYRELLGTTAELGYSEHQRMRAQIRAGLQPRDSHGFTWRSLGGTVAQETIAWTDFTFGVEIECTAPFAMPAMESLINRLGETGWRVVGDGSVSAGPGHWPMEVVSPVLQGQAGLERLRKVMDAMKAAGARVNASCGLHVHIGVRGMAPARVRKIAIAFLNAEQHFDALVPPARRDNRYCNSNVRRVGNVGRTLLRQASTIRQIADVMNGGNSAHHYNHFRYHKLNFQSFVRHGTIEFREHGGTVESEKACAWVRLITGFCARAAAQPEQQDGAESFDQWIASVTDEAGQQFMRARRSRLAERFAARAAA